MWCTQRRLLAAAAGISCAALGLGGSIATAGAKTPETQVNSISPANGPEFSSVAVTIHGTNFDTEPGATSVTFGGEAALSVTCSTSKRCVAMSPELPEGTVPVVVTSNGETSTNVIEFTYETYAPPQVPVVLYGRTPGFASPKIKDDYAGIFDPGNIYLQIPNETEETVTISNAEQDRYPLKPGEVLGLNLPVSSTPYLYTINTGLGKKERLKVFAEEPK